MAEFQPVAGLARGQGGSETDPAKALTAASSMMLAQAHAGLYSLEAAKQGMLVGALRDFQQSGDPATLANAGFPQIAEQMVGYMKGRESAKNDLLASDATYISALPPDQQDQAVAEKLDQREQQGWISKLEHGAW